VAKYVSPVPARNRVGTKCSASTLAMAASPVS
jgi:hypothetical protein